MELGFRPVASAGWGAACRPRLPRHVIILRGRSWGRRPRLSLALGKPAAPD